jgi:hypothetical protein
MKQLVFVSLLFIFFGSYAQELDQRQIRFVNDFVQAVELHQWKNVYRLLDRDYRKAQTKFLSGNKEQLVNELFSGSNGSEFVVIPVSEVLKFEVAEVEQNSDGSFTYIFRVRDAVHDIYSALQLVKRGRRYGFVGASG